MAKICEGGKKQRKNWSVMWSVLTSDQLLLYKETPTAASVVGRHDVMFVGGAAEGHKH